MSAQDDRAVLRELATRYAEVAADPRPARLSWGGGGVGFVKNRRRFDEEGRYGGMGPNPEGFTDPRVRVLRVDAPEGPMRAVLFLLACHAVTFNQHNLKLSGGYENRGLVADVGYYSAEAEDAGPATVRDRAGRAGRSIPSPSGVSTGNTGKTSP